MTERELVEVKGICPLCGEASSVMVYADELRAYHAAQIDDGPKRFVPVAFPEMKPEDRETLMTGIHPKCWEAMFADVEE